MQLDGGNVQYPAPLFLDQKPLPWVTTATHLGHEFHQASNMDYDTKCKRGRFIGESTEIRETFSFAEPSQILHAVRVHCSHFYGSMLWDLRRDAVGQFCRSWNTCVKLAFHVPRSTHTYLVENVLAPEFTPVKTELMARYLKFHQGLVNSNSFEIQALVHIIQQDVRSTTARNLELISSETGKSWSSLTAKQIRQDVIVPEVPVNHVWRVRLLKRLLQDRKELEVLLVNTDDITALIDSLCSS